MTLEEGIKFAEYESIRIRKGVCKEWIDELRIESSAKRFEQLAEWLRELKAYKKVRRILSQNRIATDRYGDVVLWDDIKRVLKEVNADVS